MEVENNSEPSQVTELDLEDQLTIKTWLPTGSEYDGMTAAADLFMNEHPSVSVLINPELETSLIERDDSPYTDLFVWAGGEFLTIPAGEGYIAPITALGDAEDWSESYPSAVLKMVTIDDEVMAAPLTVERENNLFTRTPLFEDVGLAPPKSLAEFAQACAVFQEAGITPLALPPAGWALSIVVFESLLPQLLGADFYRDFVTGKADVSGPELEVLFTEFEKVLDCSNVATASFRWDEEADRFRRGAAAMYIMGDWAAAYLEEDMDWLGDRASRLTSANDFEIREAFGSSGNYVFNTSTLALATDARSPNAGREFLRMLASEDGQVAYHSVARTVPVHLKASVSQFPERLRLQAQKYRTAAAEGLLLLGYGTTVSFDFQLPVHDALSVFAAGGERFCEFYGYGEIEPPPIVCSKPARDLEALLTEIRQAYETLR